LTSELDNLKVIFNFQIIRSRSFLLRKKFA